MAALLVLDECHAVSPLLACCLESPESHYRSCLLPRATPVRGRPSRSFLFINLLFIRSLTIWLKKKPSPEGRIFLLFVSGFSRRVANVVGQRRKHPSED